MEKRLTFLLFALLTVLMSMVGTKAFAYDAIIDDIYYNFSGSTASVTYYSSGNSYQDNQNAYAYTGSVVIPETVDYNGKTYSVTSIGDDAFFNCSGLTSVTIPNSVKNIGDYAFFNCSSLTSVTIPNSVTSIGWAAFRYCSGLTSITIPNSVTSIGGSAFSGCSGLTAVTIPNSVTSIGDGAFDGCSGLASVTIPNSVTSIEGSAFNGTGWYNSQPDGLIYIDHVLLGYKGNYPTGDLVIADGTRVIAGGAFYHCSGLTSVTIPNSVTSIGHSAFGGCSGLTSVTIPNSVTSIGGWAFSGCSGLTSVTIGNSVTSIGGWAFRGCTSLTSVTIPNSVTSIGEDAFYGCSGLTSVTIGNSVTSIGDWAFYGCSGLSSVTIGNSVTSIGGGAFWDCSGLTSITIPNSVTSIGNKAFSYCSDLTSVTIPNSVTSIGQNAFLNCTSLMTIKSYIKEPFNISRFEEEVYRNGTLYVPAGTKDLYIRFDGWREFLKIEEMDDTPPAPNGMCATPTIIIRGDKIKFDCATPDAEFKSYLTMSEEFTGSEVDLGNKDFQLTITVYATAPDYDRSLPATATFTLSAGDVNGDGAVNVGDIMAIINIMAGQ